MNNKGPDPLSLLKIQDIIDIFYKVNRIKDNSYDQNFSKNLNNMNPVDRAENLIRYMSNNTDNATNNNAEIFINILRNIDLLNQNKNGRSKINSNIRKNSMTYDNDILSKIKFFLKSLNDEE